MQDLIVLPDDKWNLPSSELICAIRDCVSRLESLIQQSGVFYAYPHLIDDITQHVITDMWETACDILKKRVDSINWSAGLWYAHMYRVIKISIAEFINELKYPFSIPRQIRFGIIKLEKVMQIMLPYFDGSFNFIKNSPQFKCILVNRGEVSRDCCKCGNPCALIDMTQKEQSRLYQLISKDDGSIEKCAKSYKISFSKFIDILLGVIKYTYETEGIRTDESFMYHPENSIDIQNITDKLDKIYSKTILDEETNSYTEIKLSKIYLADMEYQSLDNINSNVLYMPHRRITSELLSLFKLESSDVLKELLTKGDEVVNEERTKAGLIPFQRKVCRDIKVKKTIRTNNKNT